MISVEDFADLFNETFSDKRVERFAEWLLEQGFDESELKIYLDNLPLEPDPYKNQLQNAFRDVLNRRKQNKKQKKK